MKRFNNLLDYIKDRTMNLGHSPKNYAFLLVKNKGKNFVISDISNSYLPMQLIYEDRYV